MSGKYQGSLTMTHLMAWGGLPGKRGPRREPRLTSELGNPVK